MILIEVKNNKGKRVLAVVSTLTPRFKVMHRLLLIPFGYKHQQWSIWNE